MEYTPVEWHTGDVITEEKLNSMVNGITEGVSEVLLATFTSTPSEENPQEIIFTLNKTYNEIKNAKFCAITGYVSDVKLFFTIEEFGYYDDKYTITANLGMKAIRFEADTENDFPSGTLSIE